jgi:glucose dehydrogenase
VSQTSTASWCLRQCRTPKIGLIYIFNREMGEPLVPIEERPVPQIGKVVSEMLSPTQPVPIGMPTLAPQGFTPAVAWGFGFIAAGSHSINMADDG